MVLLSLNIVPFKKSRWEKVELFHIELNFQQYYLFNCVLEFLKEVKICLRSPY